MADPVFTGVGVALVTLFDDDGGVDLGATAELARDLAAAGMRAIVIAGSTGEAATLDGPERVALVKVVREAIPADVPIVVGTGAPSARQAAHLTAEVVAGGADAVLVLSPPLAADPVPYYRDVVAAAGSVPVLGYHFPLMSAPGIDVDALARLTDVGIVGLKDSSGDPARLVRTLEAFDGDLYVGSPWLLSAAGPLGATGAILAVANVEPELSIAAFDGDVAAQRQLAATAQRASGPAGVKAVLAERTGRSSRTRGLSLALQRDHTHRPGPYLGGLRDNCCHGAHPDRRTAATDPTARLTDTETQSDLQRVAVSISWPRRARPTVSNSLGAAWMCWVGTWASRRRRCSTDVS